MKEISQIYKNYMTSAKFNCICVSANKGVYQITVNPHQINIILGKWAVELAKKSNYQRVLHRKPLLPEKKIKTIPTVCVHLSASE